MGFTVRKPVFRVLRPGHTQTSLLSYRDYSKIFVNLRLKIGFQDQSLLNTGQKYCKMLQREHSAILSTFIKLPFVIKIFVLSIFEWPFYTDFTVVLKISPIFVQTKHDMGLVVRKPVFRVLRPGYSQTSLLSYRD